MNRDELIAEIKKQLQAELQDYKKSLSDKIPAEHKQQAQEFKNEATEFVKENPWASVGLAAFAGFVLARMFYRKRGE